jgi:hypothetical protein
MDFITQNFYGARLEYKFLSAGVEYDDYASTIIPYKMTHYFVTLQGDIKSKFLYTITGNMREYKLTTENVVQEFNDISGNLCQQLNSKSNVNLNVSYRKQKGAGIDMELLTTRVEYTVSYRKLFFTLGIDLYRRTFIGEELNFNGGTIQLSRRF